MCCVGVSLAGRRWWEMPFDMATDKTRHCIMSRISTKFPMLAVDSIAHYETSNNSIRMVKNLLLRIKDTSVLAVQKTKQKISSLSYTFPFSDPYSSCCSHTFFFGFFILKSEPSFKFPPTSQTYLYSYLKYVFKPLWATLLVSCFLSISYGSSSCKLQARNHFLSFLLSILNALNFVESVNISEHKEHSVYQLCRVDELNIQTIDI